MRPRAVTALAIALSPVGIAVAKSPAILGDWDHESILAIATVSPAAPIMMASCSDGISSATGSQVATPTTCASEQDGGATCSKFQSGPSGKGWVGTAHDTAFVCNDGRQTGDETMTVRIRIVSGYMVLYRDVVGAGTDLQRELPSLLGGATR